MRLPSVNMQVRKWFASISSISCDNGFVVRTPPLSLALRMCHSSHRLKLFFLPSSVIFVQFFAVFLGYFLFVKKLIRVCSRSLFLIREFFWLVKTVLSFFFSFSFSPVFFSLLFLHLCSSGATQRKPSLYNYFTSLSNYLTISKKINI